MYLPLPLKAAGGSAVYSQIADIVREVLKPTLKIAKRNGDEGYLAYYRRAQAIFDAHGRA